MSRFFGVFRYEFNMSIRRLGLWIAYILLFVFYTLSVFWQFNEGEKIILTNEELLQFAGRMGFTFNLFLPVAAGILAADRMQRDFLRGLRELQTSTPLTSLIYILGKYFGVVAASLLPILIWIWLITTGFIINGNAPFQLLYTMTFSFLTITLPAIAFVTAFSLACPLLMPLRVYQILFTGYWFWGNYLNPDEIPTLSGTYLTPSGMFATQGYFGAFTDMSRVFTATEATINLLTLGACIFAVLFITKFYLERQLRRS